MMWGLGAEAQPIGQDITAPGAVQIWTHDYSACAVNLDGDADEFLVVLHADGLAIADQWFSVHGESI